MARIRRSVSFALEAKDGGDTARIRCVVTWNGERLRLGTGLRASPGGWEPSLRRCRAKTYHGREKTPAAHINRRLDELEDLIGGVFAAYEASGRMPTREEVKSAIDAAREPQGARQAAEDGPSLIQAFDEYVSACSAAGGWSLATIQKHATLRKHLCGMGRGLTFEKLAADGYAAAVRYFSSIPDSLKRKGLGNRTILKDIALIKTFVRWATERGYCDDSVRASQRVRLKTADRTVVYLTWEELMRVYGFDFGSRGYLARARDVFCFCCFTSLRYSDARNLRRSDVSDDAITITTVKTRDKLTIELNKYSKAILDRYAAFDFPNGRALPVCTNQRMNEYLKEIGRLCGIDAPVSMTHYKGARRIDEVRPKYELLSTHAGRRTFVCNALMLGIPPDIVMKWTGHSNYSAMKPYIEIADSAKRRAMSAFDRAGQEEGQKEGQKSGDE